MGGGGGGGGTRSGSQKIFYARAEARRHIAAQYGLFAIKIVSISVNHKSYDLNGPFHPNRVRGVAHIHISWRTSPLTLTWIAWWP